jgi:hypothetical protein
MQHFYSQVEEQSVTIVEPPRKQYNPLARDDKILKLFDASRFNTYHTLYS